VAARAAAVRIDDATLAHLEELIGVMREAAARDDHRAEADADHAFHHAIVKASGNHMLEHVWQTMRLSITTCVTHSVTHRSLHEIAERHTVVLDALRAHDPDRAEAAIRRHIEEPGEWIRAAHKEEPSAPGLEGDGKAAAL
jgi:DNA-binding FadR family transcriptional regulator